MSISSGSGQGSRWALQMRFGTVFVHLKCIVSACVCQERLENLSLDTSWNHVPLSACLSHAQLPGAARRSQETLQVPVQQACVFQVAAGAAGKPQNTRFIGTESIHSVGPFSSIPSDDVNEELERGELRAHRLASALQRLRRATKRRVFPEQSQKHVPGVEVCRSGCEALRNFCSGFSLVSVVVVFPSALTRGRVWLWVVLAGCRPAGLLRRCWSAQTQPSLALRQGLRLLAARQEAPWEAGLLRGLASF